MMNIYTRLAFVFSVLLHAVWAVSAQSVPAQDLARSTVINPVASPVTANSYTVLQQKLLPNQATTKYLPQSQSSPASSNPLDPDRAFVLSAMRKQDIVQIRFDIAPGYYLYREKIGVEQGSQILLRHSQLPKGELKYDETFAKQLETFRGRLEFNVAIPNAGGVRNQEQKMASPLLIRVHSQGCADIGLCYPPQLHELTFAAGQNQASTQSVQWHEMLQTTSLSPNQAQTQAQTQAKPQVQVQSQTPITSNRNTPSILLSAESSQDIANTQPLNIKPERDLSFSQTSYLSVLSSGKIWLLMLTFIGFGLLLTFTPCVLPMLPIVSNMVLSAGQKAQMQSDDPKQSTQQSAWYGFLLSASYVLGMSVVYTTVGVLAGLFGSHLTLTLQQPPALILFALLMVLLAGAQFGWYTLQLPSAWLSRLQTIGEPKQRNVDNSIQAISKPKTSQYTALWGAALLGALSALMVGPCITAPLAATLGFIAQTGNAVTGGLALFSLSLGMGIPLVLIGIGGAKILPRVGAWMNDVKFVFGLMLLGLALWTVQSLLHPALHTLLWAVLFLMLAKTLGALQLVQVSQHGLQKLLQAVGYVLVLWVVCMVLGAANGHFSVTQPLKTFGLSSLTESKLPQGVLDGAGLTGQSLHTPFERITSVGQLSQRLANTGGKPVLLDFYADWCVSCIEFEQYTFANPEVARALKQFVLLQVDVTKNTAGDQALLKKMGVFGPPGIVFFNTKGQEISDARVIGFQAAEPFLKHLRQVLAVLSHATQSQ